MDYSPSQPAGGWSLLWSFVLAKRRTIGRVVLTLAVVGAAGISILILLEMASAPWARSLGLWPTLTGDWTGQIETADGRSRPVFFAIRGWVPRRGRASIEGRARLCERGGSIRDFEISGRPDNWRGTRFHISMSSEHDSGLVPGELQGEWVGGEVRAAGPLVSRGAVATATAEESRAPEARPQVHYTLRRGSEADFLAACQQLTRRD